MLPQEKRIGQSSTVTPWSWSQAFSNTLGLDKTSVGFQFGPEGVRMEVPEGVRTEVLPLKTKNKVIVHAPDHGVKKVLSSGRAAAPSPPEQEAAGSRQKENEARPSLRHGCHSSPSLPALHYCSLLLPASSMIFY